MVQILGSIMHLSLGEDNGASYNDIHTIDLNNSLAEVGLGPTNMNDLIELNYALERLMAIINFKNLVWERSREYLEY